MDSQEFLKKSLFEILTILIFSAAAFLLFGKTIYSLIAFLLSASVSFLFFFYGHHAEQKRMEELSAIRFLYALMLKIFDGYPLKVSYENSLRYLLGSRNIYPLETLMEKEGCPYPLGRFSPIFNAILEKEKQNEVHLPNYLPLIEDIGSLQEEFRKDLYGSRAKKRKALAVSLILSMLLVIAVSYLSPDTEKYFTPILPLLVLLYSSLLPSIEFTYLSEMSKAAKHVS